MRVVYRAAALRDLAAIQGGRGFDDLSTAKPLHRRLLNACEGLADFPEVVRLGRCPALRELVTVRSYVTVYRIQQDDVVVLRIRHGARLR